MTKEQLLSLLARGVTTDRFKTRNGRYAFSVSIVNPSVKVCGEKTLELALQRAIDYCESL